MMVCLPFSSTQVVSDLAVFGASFYEGIWGIGVAKKLPEMVPPELSFGAPTGEIGCHAHLL